MLKEDIERLEREASIFRAKQGPGRTCVDQSIARNKADFQKWSNRQAEINTHRSREAAKTKAWGPDR